MRIRLTAVAFLFALGCAGPFQPDTVGTGGPLLVSLESRFALRVGQQARVSGTPIVIRMLRVSDDSRCPVDVQCVWAGNAVVHLELARQSEQPASLALNTGIAPSAGDFLEWTVRLEGLEPAPRSGSAISQIDYVASLFVNRR